MFREVVLDGGTVEPADVVVAGVGITPRTQLAAAAGLVLDPAPVLPLVRSWCRRLRLLVGVLALAMVILGRFAPTVVAESEGAPTTTAPPTTRATSVGTTAAGSADSADRGTDYSTVYAAAVTGFVAIVTGVLTAIATVAVPKRQAKEARATALLDRQRTELDALSAGLTNWAAALTEVARLRAVSGNSGAARWTRDATAGAVEQIAYFTALAHAKALPVATPELQASDAAEYERRNELFRTVIYGPLVTQREAVLDAVDETTQDESLRKLAGAVQAAVVVIVEEIARVG